jgi:hypothetical protein
MRPLLLLAAAVPLLLAACDRAAPTTQPKHPSTPDATRTDLRNPEQASDVLAGDVLIQTIPGSNAVFVALDGGSRPGLADRIVDQLFVLQREGAGSAEGRLKLSGARMLYEGRSLLIRPRDGSPALALTVGPAAPLSERGRAFLGRTPVRDRWVGYGLSRRTGHWQLQGAFFTPGAVASLIPSCRKVAAPKAGGPSRSFGVDNYCDSGGIGSSNCSTGCGSGGSCSTSCMGGYHSCCNQGTCQCTCIAN